MNTDINSQELLEVAQQLSGLIESPSIPSQAHLRRAVSCSYYALFHELIATAVDRMYASTGDRRTEKEVISRWYSHSEMKTVCQWVKRCISGSKLPSEIAKLINQPPTELNELSKAFITLQDARHVADYDNAVSYTPHVVHSLIETSGYAISLIPKLQGDRIFENYLMLLLGGPKFAVRLAA